MNETPKPFVICPSVTVEDKYEVCNVWHTDPCSDCPIPEKIEDFMTKSGAESTNNRSQK